MAFPFLNNAQPTGRTAPAGRALLRSLPCAPARPMRRMLFEPLEPRVLLSADNALAGVTDSIRDGFDALYSELEELIASDDVFQTYVPGFLTKIVEGGQPILVSPTFEQAMTLNDVVTFDSGLEADASLGERFAALMSAEGNPWELPSVFHILDVDGDDSVTLAEAFGVLVLGQIEDYLATTAITDVDSSGDVDVNDLALQLAAHINASPDFRLPNYLLAFDLNAVVVDITTNANGDLAWDLVTELSYTIEQQIDLGYEADVLDIALDPGDPPTPGQPFQPANPTTVDVKRSISFAPLTFGFSNTGDAPVSGDDFYMAAPGGMEMGVEFDKPVFGPPHLAGMDINVGFLGTDVVDGEGVSLDMFVLGFAEDPSNPEPLGFTGFPVTAPDTITAPDAPSPDAFPLEHALQFSLRIGAADLGMHGEVTVPAGTTLALLLDALQDAVDDVFGAGIITVGDDGTAIGAGGKIQFSIPDVDPGAAGFDDQVSGTTSIEASSVSPYVDVDVMSFNVPDFSFFLALNGQLPKLVEVQGFAATEFDLGGGAFIYVVTTDDLIDAINAALNTAGLGIITAADSDSDGRIALHAPPGSTLEISRTLILDNVEKITIDEMAAADVFSVEADPDASYTVDLKLKAKEGLELPGSSDKYEPEGTIEVDIDPFNEVEGVVVDRVPSTGDPVIKAKFPLVLGEDMLEMLDFNVIGVPEMLGIVNQLATWAERLAASDLFTNFDLPFAEAALADLLAFGDMVRDALLVDDRDDELQDPLSPEPSGPDLSRLLAWIDVDPSSAFQFELLPTFNNVQNFETRLARVLRDFLSDDPNPAVAEVEALVLIDASYDPGSRELTFFLKFGHNLVPEGLQTDGGVKVPLDFSLDLEPLGAFETSSQLALTAEGEMELTLGILLGKAATPLEPTSKLLSDINDGAGVELNTHLALTTVDDIDPIVGRLSSNALFDLSWWPEGEEVPDTATILVTRAATADNLGFDDLLGDINDALAAADVGGLFEAVASHAGTGDFDTGRIVLAPKQGADVERFQVDTSSGNAAFRQLGLASQSAATVSLVAPLKMTTAAPGQALEFDLYIAGADFNPADKIEISVGTALTEFNSTLSDLVNDVNQALADAGLEGIIVASRAGNHLVLSAVQAGIHGFRVDAGTDAAQYLGLDNDAAKARLESLGVDVGGIGIGDALVAGVELRAQDVPVNPFGRLSDEVTFTLNGEAFTLEVADAAANSSILDLVRTLNSKINGNTELQGKLIADLDGFNVRLRALHSSIDAIEIENLDADDAERLGFSPDYLTSTAELRLVANRLAPVSFGVSDDASFEVSFTDGDGTKNWTATLAAAVTLNNRTLFDLAADINQAMNAGFIAEYAGLTVADNPLVAVVQGERIVIGLKTEGGRAKLVDVLSEVAEGVTAFSVEADGDSAAAEQLRLVEFTNTSAPQSNNAGNADFVVYFSDGTSVEIDLDELAGPGFLLDDGETIASLISHIYLQTGNPVSLGGEGKLFVDLQEDGSGLVLKDESGAAANGEFRVVAVNGSPAALHLGILASDASQFDLGKFDPADEGSPDNTIIGGRLATLDLLDRVFLQDPTLSASIAVATDGEAEVEANFGFVGVKLHSQEDQVLYKADVSVPFLTEGDDDEGQEDNRLLLRNLFTNLNLVTNLWKVVDLPEVTLDGDFDSFSLALSLFPDNLGSLVELGTDPKVSFDLQHAGMLEKFASAEGEPTDSVRLEHLRPPEFEGPAFAPLVDVNFTEADLEDLFRFADVEFDDILGALRAVSGFLKEFAGFPFLSEEIPLLGFSLNDVLEVAERFDNAVETLALNPAGGLQLLAQSLRQGFGLPDFGDLSIPANADAFKSYLAERGMPTDDLQELIGFALNGVANAADGDLLRLDLRLPLGFAQSRSIDLDLGDVDFLDQLGLPVDLQGGAGLSVTGYLDVRLSFGIDLNNPGTVYLFDDDTGVVGAVTAQAENLAFNAAIGPMGVFIRDGSAAVDISFGLDDAGSDPDSKVQLDAADPGALFEGADPFEPDFLGEIKTTLPIFFPDDSTYLGDIVLDLSGANAITVGNPSLVIPDFSLPGILTLPDFSFIDLSQIDPFGSIPLLLDTLDFFLQGLQDLLDGEVFGLRLPLLGDQLASGADFIENMRREVLEPIRQFVEQAPESSEDLIEALLQALLGPGSAGVTIGDGGPLLTEFLGINPFEGLDLLAGAVETFEDTISDGFFWRLSLGDTYTPPLDIGFDLGFPALGLSMDADLDIEITWELALGLGISRADGAYILLGDHGANGDTELVVSVDVSLPEGANIQGRLGFLQLEINNRTSAGNPAGTHFSASFGVDVFNGQQATDARLSFSELGLIDANVDLSAEAMVDLELVAKFNEAILPETISALVPSLQTGFFLHWDTGNITSDEFDFAASLKFVGFDDVRLDMGSFFGDFLGPVVNKIAEVTEPLQPVIDVFTMRLPGISDLAGRTITLLDIAALFGDIDPSMIYQIADIITLANDIAEISGEDALLIPLGDLTLFDAEEVVEGFEGLAANLASPTFRLDGSGGDDAFDFDDLLEKSNQVIEDFKGMLDGVADGSKTAKLSQSLVNGTAAGADSLIFPLFDNPTLAFHLLLGRDVSLVETAPFTFSVDFTYVQKFPIWGPLFARITGSVGLDIRMAFGYDTFGPRKFAEGNFSNPLDLIAGFYVNDTDQPGGIGADVPELVLRGELFAGAEINLGIATAGVEGGVILTVNFDLYDPDQDGKVRISELVGNFLYEFNYGNPAVAPIAIFDVFGDVAVQLRAFIEFLFFEKTFDITPPITLVEFAIEFDREPILATERGDGALVLHIGPNSAARLNGDTRADIGGEIYVKSVSATEVLVWSPTFNVDESAAQSYRVSGDDKMIIAYGGAGNDLIDLSGLEAEDGIGYFVDGGAGDDEIWGGHAGGALRGGLGDDKLYGGDNADLIIGGLGNDYIEGGAGTDWIFGDNGSVTEFKLDSTDMIRFRSLATADDGDDVIHAGDGNDIVFGGGGFDLIFGDAGHDLLIGDGGYFEGPAATGGIPMANGVVDITRIITRGIGEADRVYGGAGNDTILGGPGNDLLDGGSDNDLVSGGPGDDTVYGGTGADWLFGDDGHDLIFGYRDPFAPEGFDLDPGDAANADPNDDLADYIEGGDGNDFIRGQGGGDTIHGNRGADIIFGDEGNDIIGAGFTARPWLGPDDDHPYNSEAGGDIIFGGADDDTVNAGTGGDLVFGDDGLVVYLNFPDTTGLLAAHQLGSRIRTDGGSDHKLIGDGDETDLIKPADLVRQDGIGTTPDLYATEPLATDGDDYIAGGDGNDIVFGGGGDDEIYGDFDPTQDLFGPRPTGQDVLIGDGGRVEIFGRRYEAIEAVANADYDGEDEISGNDGGDYIFGGGNEDLIFGFENPAQGSNLPLESLSENDSIFGDNGRIEFDPSDRFNRITRMFTTFAGADESGASDEIWGQWGDDVIFGGLNSSNDVLSGGLGNDIVIGDQGEVLFYAPGLGDAWEVFAEDDFPTFDPNFAGREFWDESFPLFLVRSYRDNIGGSDIVSGNQGDDILIGGTAGDFMYGDDPTGSTGAADGEDIMLGDNGEVWFNIDFEEPEFVGDDPVPPPNTSIGRLVAQVAAMPYASAIDRINTSDLAENTGGADFMSGNAGADILFGGVNDGGVDRLFGDREVPDAATLALDADDILVGDNGVVDFAFAGDTDRTTLDLIRSFEDALGGTDILSGDAGHDVGIGGTGGDVIFGDRAEPDADSLAADGDDTLIGDNADIFLVAAPDPLPAGPDDLKLVLDAAVYLIRSTDEDYPVPLTGGVDTIAGNAGDDVILGGVEGDYLYGDGVAVIFQDPENDDWTITSRTAVRSEADGADIILGDNGALEWLSDGRFGEVMGIDIGAQNQALFDHFDGGADDDVTTLDLVTTEQPNNGGRDWIWGGDGNDALFGGTDADTMFGDNGFAAQGMGGIGDGLPESSGDGDGDDLMFGDHGRLYPQFSLLRTGPEWRDFGHSRNFFAIDTGELDGGEGDRMWGQAGADNLLGQQGDDRMWGGDDDDDMIGGHNVSGGWDELGAAGAIEASITNNAETQDFNDLMDGGDGDDVMAGDNAIVWRRDAGDAFDPRFRALTAEAIYTTTASEINANVDVTGQDNPNGTAGRDIELLDHDFTVQGDPQGRYGRDIMAGGAHEDRMFGQLGDDLMQGDGEIELDPAGAPYLHWQVDAPGLAPDPDPYDTLHFNIPERTSDGDDYLEGNGGADLMFGGLGQDDMIGGSSELYGLDAWAKRPDGSDILFGGAGIRTERNDFGDDINGIAFAEQDAETNAITTLEGGHARDADYMMGDNANIFRLVNGDSGAFLEFNYDAMFYGGAERIIPRAMMQLDYHLGGADFHGGSYLDGQAHVTGADPDNGAPDFMHGEAGDDVMFGMTGSDLMFGGAQDDDMVGGYGHDWFSGGTGRDGVIGDDGLVLTSRNSAAYGEPLYGIAPLLANDPEPKYSGGNVLNEVIYTPGKIQQAMINIEHELKKSVDLTPFSYDPTWVGMDDEYPDNDDPTPFADDIVFGGLNSDWLHGGSGDDAISGAEALESAWVPDYMGGVLDLGYLAVGLPDGPWVFLDIPTYGNVNPGNVLGFNPVDEDGWQTQNRLRAGEFTLYDEYDPLRKIMLTNSGELDQDGGGLEFLLNFDPDEGVLRPGDTVGKKNQEITYPDVHDDGADAIYGGNANDWLVGGTGRDRIYGGWGNDLLNADDHHETNGALNDEPDTHPTYEDIAYGGAGRDVLIANTGGDRLIDWVGEYNSYLVPFAPFGMATVSRTVQPFLPEYLYALSLGDGIDASRSDDTGGDPERNGEPFGELGLVLQKDFAWQAQTGAPADPQAGNIPGGKRDVLRSADFSGDEPQGFMVDSGQWSLQSGRYQVEPTTLGGDALSVWHHDQYQPNYFEVLATVNVVKPIKGYKANAYIVFDYQSADDFKFAGLNGSTNKVEIGHKQGDTWTVLTSINLNVKHSTDYNLLLSVNGTSVILVVNNQHSVSYTFAPRTDADGILYNINAGMIGLGADNGRAAIGNMHLLVLPPQITHSASDDFDTAPALLGPLEGSWTLADGRLAGQPEAGTQLALASGSLQVAPSAVLQLETTFSTAATGGIVFDQYATNDFKWAAWSKATNQVQIGYYTARDGWVVSQSVSMNLDGDVDFKVTLKGTTVSVLINDAPAVSHAFNAIATDGHFGLFARGGTASFDHFTVMTDDPSFAPPASNELTAAFAGSGENATALDEASLEAIAQAAMNRWAFILGGVPSLFYGLEFMVADLGGLALARVEGNVVAVDENAAGHGWFIDPTPYDDGEFRARTADGLRATPSSEAYGRMDLLTVLMHELGHAIGYHHDSSVPGATALMAEDLVPGLRAVDFVPPGQQAGSGDSQGDLYPAAGDPQPALNGKRGSAPASGWTWDADKGAFVQDAAGWQTGRLFSYLSLGTAMQADDWLTSESADDTSEPATEDWLEFAADVPGGDEGSLIEWAGL